MKAKIREYAAQAALSLMESSLVPVGHGWYRWEEHILSELEKELVAPYLEWDADCYLVKIVKHTEWDLDCLRWRGAILTGEFKHYCLEWDDLPVDETCMEFSACTCFTNEGKVLKHKNRLNALTNILTERANDDEYL